MSLLVVKGSPEYGCVHRVVQTVPTLHARGGEEVKHTFFASASGGPADCSSRLKQVLREGLRLGEGTTSTSLRRAIVDKMMSDPSKTEEEKRCECPVIMQIACFEGLAQQQGQ
jgi:hypothetical protein